jgi:FMN-dependent NADH-azoreductase
MTDSTHRILRIDSSLNGANAVAAQLTQKWLGNVTLQGANIQVSQRDLSSADLPHLTGEQHAGFSAPEAERTPHQQLAINLSDTLISELRAADTIVLGVPLYNFGLPSSLKAWIDHVARSGETFNYTSEGPVGTLTGKKVIVIATSGGVYAGGPNDNQTPYLKQVLGFIGLTDVEFVYAEGLAMSGRREASIEQAGKQLNALTEGLIPLAELA